MGYPDSLCWEWQSIVSSLWLPVHKNCCFARIVWPYQTWFLTRTRVWVYTPSLEHLKAMHTLLWQSYPLPSDTEARGSVVGWGTKLQVGRSWVKVPIRSLDFFPEWRNHSRYGPGVDSASNRNEYQEYFWGKERPAHKTESFAICEPISRKCGILDVSPPYRLPRSVRGIAFATYSIHLSSKFSLIASVLKDSQSVMRTKFYTHVKQQIKISTTINVKFFLIRDWIIQVSERNSSKYSLNFTCL
jgi:hypothetical protein